MNIYNSFLCKLFIAFLFFCQLLFGQIYYPLAVGNEWHYETRGFNMNNLDSTLWSDTTIVKIIGDTLMPNDTTYYIFESTDIVGGKYVYSDSSSVYYYNDYLDKGVKVFNLKSELDEYTYFEYDIYHSSWLFQIDTVNIFNYNNRCLHFMLDGLIVHDVSFTENFGIQYYYSPGEPAGEIQSSTGLMFCKLSDKEYGSPLVSIKNQNTPIKNFYISQNFPNPFNPGSKFRIILDKPCTIVSKLYNTIGQEVLQIYSGYKSAGKHVLSIDGSHLNSGIYFYMVKTGGITKYKKCILLK